VCVTISLVMSLSLSCSYCSGCKFIVPIVNCVCVCFQMKCQMVHNEIKSLFFVCGFEARPPIGINCGIFNIQRPDKRKKKKLLLCVQNKELNSHLLWMFFCWQLFSGLLFASLKSISSSFRTRCQLRKLTTSPPFSFITLIRCILSINPFHYYLSFRVQKAAATAERRRH